MQRLYDFKLENTPSLCIILCADCGLQCDLAIPVVQKLEQAEEVMVLKLQLAHPKLQLRRFHELRKPEAQNSNRFR